MPQTPNPGEEKAWDILQTMKPEEVCSAAGVSYDAASRRYRIWSFGMDFEVAVESRTISSTDEGSDILLNKLAYFFKLAVLWYLVSAKDVSCTGTKMKLENIQGGDIFTKGSHALPLEPVAQKYATNRDAFIERGKRLGAEIEKSGDASLRLLPLPRIPVVLTLWLEDEEFPARLDLFFDSTCQMQIPLDIIWSVAMMTILILM